MTDEPVAPRKSCFIVSPIGSAGSEIRRHADWLLEEIIEPVFAKYFTEFDIERSDKIASPGMIDSQIIERILKDDLVIIDMTFLNANVFYEMGIRHMTELPVVVMFKVGTDIPFDVKLQRAIAFSYDLPSDLKAGRLELRGAVSKAIAAEHNVDTPITRVRAISSVKNGATPLQEMMLDRISALEHEQALRKTRPKLNSAANTLLIEPRSVIFDITSSKTGAGSGLSALRTIGNYAKCTCELVASDEAIGHFIVKARGFIGGKSELDTIEVMVDDFEGLTVNSISVE